MAEFMQRETVAGASHNPTDHIAERETRPRWVSPLEAPFTDLVSDIWDKLLRVTQLPKTDCKQSNPELVREFISKPQNNFLFKT